MKACIYCKHFEYQQEYGYSEYTWDSGYIDCEKGHFNSFDVDISESGELYKVARDCTDFKLTDDVKQMIEDES